MSSRAYATRAYDARLGLIDTILSNASEGLLVSAELDQGVADDAVRSRGAGKKALRSAPVVEPLTELVPDQCERAEAENGIGVFRTDLDGPPQRRLGSRQIGRVGSLSPAQLVREAELREQRPVLRPAADLLLEPGDGGRRDSACRARERPLCERHGSG